MKFKESKAIYLQIAERVCDEILRGKYLENERIPSVREYAAEVEVNINTMMRSFDFLQQDQIIYNKRGIGYFVSEGAKERIFNSNKRKFMDEELEAFFKQIYQLEISPDEVMEMYKVYAKQQLKNKK